MRINDITNQKINNINAVIKMAKDSIVILTTKQWETVTTKITYDAISTLLTETTYLGFFPVDDRENDFHIAIFTGENVPKNLILAWTRISNLTIATPHTTDTPLVMFSPSKKLSEYARKFVLRLFSFINDSYVRRPVANYGLTTTSFIQTTEENRYYWMFGNIVQPIPNNLVEGTSMINAFAIPGQDDTVIFLDVKNTAHYYKFDPEAEQKFSKITRTAL